MRSSPRSTRSAVSSVGGLRLDLRKIGLRRGQARLASVLKGACRILQLLLQGLIDRIGLPSGVQQCILKVRIRSSAGKRLQNLLCSLVQGVLCSSRTVDIILEVIGLGASILCKLDLRLRGQQCLIVVGYCWRC